MSDQDTDQEPSIEEILTSIRQIISDDDDEAEAAEAAPAPEPTPEPEPEPEEDIVELTDKIEDEEPEDEPEIEEIEVGMQDVNQTYQAPEPEPAPAAKPKPAPAPRPEPVMQEDDDDSLLSDAAEDAAYDAFSELARKTAIESGGITLEEIVRKELRPHLKGWLDRHLPAIIERLVQEELDRVAKRAMEE